LDRARPIARIAKDKKGEDVVLMDMRTISSVCGWFVLISASSFTRMKSVSQTILKKATLWWCFAFERQRKTKSLPDFVGLWRLVAHVFYEGIREFYELERLWSIAPREWFDSTCLKKTSPKKYLKNF